MSRSQSLFALQQLDTGLDSAHKRIQEIDIILMDSSQLDKVAEIHREMESNYAEKSSILEEAEREVSFQNAKIEQNQKKLYSGAITNPKELEDLQMEANALSNYLQVLEERQLEAMLVSDQARLQRETSSMRLTEISSDRDILHQSLNKEKFDLESEISSLSDKKSKYLDSEDLPDLPVYESLRQSSGGIAVTLMINSSCSSCGANIPSAIEQISKSPTKLAFCPTCKRILHPG